MSFFHFTPGARLQFMYTNYKGDREERHVEFHSVSIGANEWYPEEQFFLHCLDFDRQMAARDFSILKIEPNTVRLYMKPEIKT